MIYLVININHKKGDKKMEKELYYNITYKDGGTYSGATTFFVDDNDGLKQAIKDERSGRSGMDISDVAYISYWDEAGNEY